LLLDLTISDKDNSSDLERSTYEKIDMNNDTAPHQSNMYSAEMMNSLISTAVSTAIERMAEKFHQNQLTTTSRTFNENVGIPNLE